MNRSIDKLGAAVDSATKNSAGKVMSKDNLIDLITDNIEALRSVRQFFSGLAEANGKLKAYVDQNAKNTSMKSMVLYSAVLNGLTGMAKRAQQERFLGAFSDAAESLIVIMEEFNDNIAKLFTDKTITIYNTKISQVAVYGMINNADIFSKFVLNYFGLLMSDRSSSLPKPAPYIMKELDADVESVIAIVNRTINNKLSKNFVASILKYRNSGSDIGVVGSDNKPSVSFTKINSEVTESDIHDGAKGLKIFRWIGDFFADREVKKLHKLRYERDLINARLQLLQLELGGYDENSPEYKRQVKIIENYIKMIDRLNQEINKREAEA